MSGGRLKWEPTGYRYVDEPTGMVLRLSRTAPHARSRKPWWWEVADASGKSMATGWAENPGKAKGNAHKALDAAKEEGRKLAAFVEQHPRVPHEIPSAPGFATSSPGVKCR